MKKKFAIYDRTVKDSDMLHPRHKDVEKQVTKQGGLVLRVFADLNHDGLSARPGFEDLLAFAEKGTLDGVAIYEIPRLSNSGSTAIADLLKLHSLGLELLSIREHINTEFSQQMFLWPLIKSLQQMNSEAKSRKIKLAIADARKNGKEIGRPGVPFEDLRMAVDYIWETMENPVEAYQPWQIQKKCNISSATYYGIKDAMVLLDSGKAVEDVINDTTIGLKTVERIEEILAVERNSK